MRAILIGVAVALALAGGSSAAPAARARASYPAAAQPTQARLLPYIQPSAKAWIAQEGKRLAAGQGDAVADAASRFATANAAQRNGMGFLALMRAEADLRNQLDSQSELGETEQLRLQMAMDRQSKLMTTLSNLLKKIDDTSQSIVQNLK